MTTNLSVLNCAAELNLGRQNPGFAMSNLTAQSETKAHVVLIDSRSLHAECMLAALQIIDPTMLLSTFRTLDAWLSVRPPGGDTMVLLCINDGELQQATASAGGLIEQIRSIAPPVRLLLLASEDRPAAIAKALDMGIVGYIPTNLSLRVVVQILHLVRAGGIFVPASSFQARPNEIEPECAPALPDIGGLSPRQILVAKALRKGTPNKVIAYELNMCESTVKVHVRQIMRKLKAKNRTQVAFLTNSMFSDNIKA